MVRGKFRFLSSNGFAVKVREVKMRNGHQVIHRQLIDIEHRVCRCKASESLEIHRLNPIGEYTRDNVIVMYPGRLRGGKPTEKP